MSNIYEHSELINAFIVEVEEQLQLLEESILELEQRGESAEVVQKIFRVAHTLKGSSSAMGFEKMKLLTHEMENILDKIRNHLLSLDKPVIDILFKCLDYLNVLIEEFIKDRENVSLDIDKIVEQLKAVLKEEDKTESIYNLDFSPTEILLTEDSKMQILQAKEMGFNSIVCEIKISEDSMMKLTRAILIMNYFNELGTVVQTIPDILKLEDESSITKVSYLVVSDRDKDYIQTRAEEELMDVDKISIVYFEDIVKDNDAKINEINTQNEKENLEPKEAAIEDEKQSLHCSNSSTKDDDKNGDNLKQEKRVYQTVRVDVERLEKMMNLIGELVIEQTRMAKVGSDLHRNYSQDQSVEDLLGISNHVSRVVSELQENVMKARMLPVQQLFNRFPRIVRDLSAELGKEINLVIEGGETEMDRTIIEEISDPLIHLIRNSVDHGIENSEIRKELKKTEKGTLSIKASHQENHVIITVEDDGAGIDLEKVKKSAVEKNIVSIQEMETMSEQQVTNLIFESGFSTSDKVTDISGRGVGMDIVRNHINKLNGIIEIKSERGRGTVFTIKLPLTLAILRGLLIKIGEITYALPISNVVEIVRKTKDHIENIKGQPVIMIRGKIIPLVWLHDYFKVQRLNLKKNISVVIIGIGEKQIGLVVDELLGNQEIVVKSLGAYIGKVDGFSGATILGDGSVACILDVVGIANMIRSKEFNVLE